MQFFKKITEGLKKTRDAFVERVSDVLKPGKKLEPEDYEALEAALLRADVGPATADRILEEVKERLAKGADDPAAALREAVRAVIELPAPPAASAPRPHVTLVVGVNGTGKTTTIAKLAHRYKEAGDSVLLVACDTFRAAAGDQLEVWAERAGVEMVRQASGADPAAVAFDAIEAAQSRGRDIVIVDTAGRLHTQTNLMEELAKIRRVIAQRLEGAPHETLLVVDATTGQNGLQQARLFGEAVHVSGVALTKLDGSAKGGIAVAIAHELGLPVKLVGVGESLDDLQPFDAGEFARALVSAD